MAIGFTYYDTPPAPTPKPTTAEIVASLSGGQKTGILNGFINRPKSVPPKKLGTEIQLSSKIIEHLYRKIDAVEETARKYMRGEVVVTPAEYDEEGNETTSAVYNDIPNTLTALKNTVAPFFDDAFTTAQVGAVLSKMVEYSKYDGSGTWTFYKEEVAK